MAPYTLSIPREQAEQILPFITDFRSQDEEESQRFQHRVMTELEVRFGQFYSERFDATFSQDEFHRLHRYLSILPFEKITTEKFVDRYYSDNIRTRTYENDTVDIIQKIKHISGISLTIDIPNYGLRISKAREKSVERVTGEPSRIATKERTSFIEKFHQIDLTSEIVNNKKSFYVEIEYNESTYTLPDFLNPIKFLLTIIQQSTYFITSTERENIILQFNSMFFTDSLQPSRITRDFINNPEDLEIRNLTSSMDTYAITDKADGLRCFLLIIDGDYVKKIRLETNGEKNINIKKYEDEESDEESDEEGISYSNINEKGMYVVRSPNRVIKISEEVPESFRCVKNNENICDGTRTLIDGELVSIGDTKLFLAFDVLFMKDMNVQNMNLMKRLKVLEDTEQEINDMYRCYLLKVFFIEGHFYQRVRDVVYHISEMRYGNDGIIMTPVNAPYMYRNQKEKTRKWKPTKLLSIDFKIVHVENNTYRILTTKKKDRKRDKRMSEVFRGTDKYPHSGLVEIPDETHDELGNPIENNQIIEFRWVWDNHSENKGHFVPFRVRYEKPVPNNTEVAKSIWKLLNEPISMDTLLGTNLVLMRRFHNQKKTNLLEVIGTGKTIMDIGTGRGGELSKYKDIGVKKLYVIEPNKENLAEFRRRVLVHNFQGKIFYVGGEEGMRGEDTDKILSEIGQIKVDAVTSFFSLTFFMKDEKIFTGLINTIDTFLKNEGVFIGTVMDGMTVNRLLKKSKKFTSPSYTIIKHYSDDDTIGFGKKITIDMKDTMVTKQTEYLFDFNLLTDSLKERGIFLEDTKMFDPPDYLSKSQKIISALNRSFVFRKTEKTKIKHLQIEKPNTELHMIAVDKVEEIKINFTEDKIVRIGTIGEGSCFVKGTRVYTTSGVKNIENIKLGDEVVSHLGNTKKVIQTFKNTIDNRDIYELEVYKTSPIKVTGNHRVYTCRYGEKPDWVSVEMLSTKHYIMIPNKTDGMTSCKIDLYDICKDHIGNKYCNYTYNLQTKKKIQRIAHYDHILEGRPVKGRKPGKFVNRYWEIDTDFCEFLGIWYGNGSITTMKRKNYTSHRGINIVSCKENTSLIDFVASTGQYMFGITPTIHKHKNQNLVTITFNSDIIGQVFYNLFCKGFTGKHVVSFIHQLNSEYIKSFISGLISSSNGCVDMKINVTLCMTNPSFMEEIHHLCRSVGICTSLYYRDEDGMISGCIRFTRYMLDIERIKKYYKDDRMERLKKSTKHLNKYAGEFLEYDNHLFLKVRSVTKTDEHPEFVYTLGIEDDHSYSVEGLIVENCLFHSVLRDISPNYKTLNKKERKGLVRKLRKEIQDKITLEKFQELGGGELAFQKIFEYVRPYLEEYFFEGEDEFMTEEEFSLLIGSVMSSFEGGLSEFKKRLYNKLDENGIEGYDPNEIDNIFTDATEEALKEYKDDIGHWSCSISNDALELISDILDLDIYIIDGTTHQPYYTGDDCIRIYKNRTSVIVLYVDEIHYEAVGRMVGGKITTSFPYDDELIRTIHQMIC